MSNQRIINGLIDRWLDVSQGLSRPDPIVYMCALKSEEPPILLAKKVVIHSEDNIGICGLAVTETVHDSFAFASFQVEIIPVYIASPGIGNGEARAVLDSTCDSYYVVDMDAQIAGVSQCEGGRK